MRQTQCLLLAFFISGCTSSGGVSDNSTSSLLTGGQMLTSPPPLQFDGSSQEFAFSATGGVVVSTSAPTANESGANYQAVLDGNGQFNSVSITSARGTEVKWDVADDDIFRMYLFDFDNFPNLIASVSADQKRFGIHAIPAVNDWNYQTFGVWLTGIGTNSGSVGVISAGDPTSSNLIPQNGTGTYRGTAVGVYSSMQVQLVPVAADMTAVVDFAARRVNLATDNSVGSLAFALGGIAAGSYDVPGLNLSGNLTYAAGSNQFSGAVATAERDGSQLTGDAVGKFYGPAGQEIGGTFSVEGDRSQVFVGTFGGKR